MITAKQIINDYLTDEKRYAEMIEQLENTIITAARRGYREVHWYYIEEDTEKFKERLLNELDECGYGVRVGNEKYIEISWC